MEDPVFTEKLSSLAGHSARVSVGTAGHRLYITLEDVADNCLTGWAELTISDEDLKAFAAVTSELPSDTFLLNALAQAGFEPNDVLDGVVSGGWYEDEETLDIECAKLASYGVSGQIDVRDEFGNDWRVLLRNRTVTSVSARVCYNEVETQRPPIHLSRADGQALMALFCGATTSDLEAAIHHLRAELEGP